MNIVLRKDADGSMRGRGANQFPEMQEHLKQVIEEME